MSRREPILFFEDMAKRTLINVEGKITVWMKKKSKNVLEIMQK